MTLPGFVSLRMTDFPEWNWDLSVGIWPLIVSYSLIDSVLAPGENIYRITLHFLVRKKIKLQNLIERGETKEEGWLSNKPRKDQNPSPLPWGEKKRLGCLLLLLEVVPMWSGESRQLLALSQCSCRTRRSSDSPGGVCLCRSQVSCEAKPSQGYCFIDRQIRIENHE